MLTRLIAAILKGVRWLLEDRSWALALTNNEAVASETQSAQSKEVESKESLRLRDSVAVFEGIVHVRRHATKDENLGAHASLRARHGSKTSRQDACAPRDFQGRNDRGGLKWPLWPASLPSGISCLAISRKGLRSGVGWPNSFCSSASPCSFQKPPGDFGSLCSSSHHLYRHSSSTCGGCPSMASMAGRENPRRSITN